MTEVNKKDFDALKAEVDDLRAGAEKYKALNALSKSEYNHYVTLEQKNRDAFLGLTPYKREAAIKKAETETNVVYKSADGAEYTKADDPRLVAMAKARDEDRKKTAALEATLADRDLRKRAEAFPHLYGTTEDAMAALKAFDSIEDEAVRENCYKMLKSQDDGLSTSFKDASTVVGVKFDTPQETDLSKRASDRAKETGEDLAKAMETILKTDKGNALLNSYNAREA